MTPAELSAALRAVLLAAQADGALPLTADQVPATVTVERPRQREHGDWASNVALQLAKKAGMPPRELAEVVAVRLGQVAGIGRVDVAGPGFLNITLEAAAAGELARTVVEAGAGYGRSDMLAGQRINLEFVSANPTGPLHIGGVRWAAVGDALARVLAGQRRGGRPVSTTSTTTARRSTVSPGRCWPGRGASRLRRTATAASTSREIAERARAEAGCGRAGPAHAAGRPGPGGFRSRGVELMFAEIKETLHDFRRGLRRVLPRGLPARVGRRRARGRPAARARAHVRGRRRDVAADDGLRRRQGPGHHQVRRRRPRTSPATWRTTSTSASAASTG